MNVSSVLLWREMFHHFKVEFALYVTVMLYANSLFASTVHTWNYLLSTWNIQKSKRTRCFLSLIMVFSNILLH